MRRALPFAACLVCAVAQASTYTVTIASDTTPVDVNETVSGQTGWHSGYFRVTQGGQVVRSFFGNTSYTWNATNPGPYARAGYEVRISAIDYEPDSGLASHFSNPGTVVWGALIEPGGGGGGN